MSVFANKIRNLRENRNLTTRMMAEELGVSSSQISKTKTPFLAFKINISKRVPCYLIHN